MDVNEGMIDLFFVTRQSVGRELVDRRDSRGHRIMGPWRDHRDSETGREWSFRDVTVDMIERHVAGTLLYRSERARLQTYGVSEDDTSIWVAIDLDVTANGAHSDQPQHFATKVDAMVAGWCLLGECEKIGVSAFVEITKSAGVRVWVFFDQPINAADANAFGRLIVKRADLHPATEVFPNTLKSTSSPVLLPYAGVADAGRQVFIEPATGEILSPPEFVALALSARAEGNVIAAAVDAAVANEEVTRLTDRARKTHDNRDPVDDVDAERRWRAVLAGCTRMREIVEQAEAGQPLGYDDWALRLLPHLRVLGEWGHAQFHRLSAFDPRYNAGEAEDKFDSIDGAPTHCDKMGCGRNPHTDCGLPQKNVSPAYFAAKDSAPATEVEKVEERITAAKYPVADRAVYHGLLGEIVSVIEPHTEADPMAVLISLLVGFGCVIGRSAYFRIEATRHYTNLYAVIVGRSSVGRKGTSLNHALNFLREGDTEWAGRRVMAGLSSGEGLIHAVRDPVEKSEPIREKGKVVAYQSVIVDDGEADKRLFVTESEFAKVLKVIQREGNSLSAILRQAWDSGDLRVLTKQAQNATGAHVSIIGHITQDELLRELDDTEVANGFANRFLWIAAKRSKLLPEGGQLDTVSLTALNDRLRDAVAFARLAGEIKRDDDARSMWREAYRVLVREEYGLFGSLIARAAPIVVRLCMIYALVDKSNVIRKEHLEAALAVWQYAEDSARFVFGNALGDPMADEILRALKARPDGMTQTEIRDMFGRNPKAASYVGRLETLETQGLVRSRREETGGKPATRWFAV